MSTKIVKPYLCSQLKKLLLTIFITFQLTLSSVISVNAQCSICSKTAQQMGEKPAKGFNAGIIYLMLTPFAIAGFVGYRWWKNNK